MTHVCRSMQFLVTTDADQLPAVKAQLKEYNAAVAAYIPDHTLLVVMPRALVPQVQRLQGTFTTGLVMYSCIW